jgi:hypothetical protein
VKNGPTPRIAPAVRDIGTGLTAALIAGGLLMLGGAERPTVERAFGLVVAISVAKSLTKRLRKP